MPVRGPHTGFDLCQFTSVYTSRFPLPGQFQPSFSPDAAQLSLELAATAYNLETENWRKAGWRDFSYQVDNTLLSGAMVNPSSTGFSGILSDYFESLAQSRLKSKNPISQIRGALRQRESSDTCKAIVMLHPMPGGRFIVAIGFMGTGKRLYDWFSNFRVSNKEGAHLGFLQLTRQFEANCDKIHFSETARELGLKKLTLSDILSECHRPGGRFFLWMAGHSQGSAVMQLFSYHAVQQGVLPRYLLGYGFASPRVLYDHPGCDLSGFPLFHIINADDVIPRVGASLHIGRSLVCMTDGDMRKTCYRKGLDSPAFWPLFHYVQTVQDTQSAFLAIIAYLQALIDRADKETAPVFPNAFSRFLPEKWASSLSGRLDSLLNPLLRQAEKAYCAASGSASVPQALLQPLYKRCAQYLNQFGTQACMQAMGNAVWLPHKLHGSMDGMLSYQFLVNTRLDRLYRKTWLGPAAVSEGMPRRPERHHPGGRFARYSGNRGRLSTRHANKEAP